MRVLSQSQQNILSLMGVDIWRHRDHQLPKTVQTPDFPTWRIAAHPESSVELVTICECESSESRLDPSAQKLLDNILYAMGFRHECCLQLLCVVSGDKDTDGLSRIFEESPVREGTPTLIFGSRAGAAVGETVLPKAGISSPTVLPALLNMLAEPTLKRTCWSQLQEMSARDN